MRSPARVEILDPLSTPLNLPFGSAWRPWEALNPQIDDAMVRQLNRFTAASPVPAGDGSRRSMDLTVNTGDAADSQQLNETLWVRTLLEGGTLDPNSGVNKLGYFHPLCPNLLVPGAAEAARYTGVQDYDDYFEDPSPSSTTPTCPPDRTPPGRNTRVCSTARSSRSRPPASTSRHTSPSATTTPSCRATRPPTSPSSRSRRVA